MSRPGLTQDEVIRAAVRLLSQGHSPSVRNVWRAVGERGSFETISKHLEAWRSALSDASLQVLPPALPHALLGPLESLWATAVQEAAAQYAQARAEAVAEANETREQLLEAQARLQAETELRAQRDEEIARQAQLHRELEEQCKALRLRLAAAAEDLARTQREHAHERAVGAAQVERERQTTADQKQAFEQQFHTLDQQLQREIERSEAQQAHWLRLVDEARQQAKEARTELQRRESASAQALEATRQQRDQAEQRALRAEAEAAAARSRAEHTDAQLAQQEQRLEKAARVALHLEQRAVSLWSLGIDEAIRVNRSRASKDKKDQLISKLRAHPPKDTHPR